MFISYKKLLWTILVLIVALPVFSLALAQDVNPAACNVEAPVSPTTINFLAWAGVSIFFYNDEFAKCNDVENLEVDAQILDFVGVTEQFRLALSAGGASPYQIVHASNTEIVEWGSAGWLLPLNDLIDKYREEYDLDDHSSTAWEGATIDGQVYGIPFRANTLHVWYRSDLFEDYGL